MTKEYIRIPQKEEEKPLGGIEICLWKVVAESDKKHNVITEKKCYECNGHQKCAEYLRWILEDNSYKKIMKKL
jgi:hypothetical protein